MVIELASRLLQALHHKMGLGPEITVNHDRFLMNARHFSKQPASSYNLQCQHVIENERISYHVKCPSMLLLSIDPIAWSEWSLCSKIQK